MLRRLLISNVGILRHLDITFDLSPPAESPAGQPATSSGSFSAGLTAVTGETGAGKTLLVRSLGLLAGARAPDKLVGVHGDVAVVKGWFEHEGREVTLSREVPAIGRARAFIDDDPVSLGRLAEVANQMMEILGQGEFNLFRGGRAQRQALDEFGGIDTSAFRQASSELARLEDEMAELIQATGIDQDTDRLRRMLHELRAADLSDPDEQDQLERRISQLEAVESRRAGLAEALAALDGPAQARDRLGLAISRLSRLGDPTNDVVGQLRLIEDGLADAVHCLREELGQLDSDPGQLASARTRLKLLVDLRRRFGPSLAEVIAYRDRLAGQLDGLAQADLRRAALASKLQAAEEELTRRADELAAARREAGFRLSEAVGQRLRELGLEQAQFSIEVAGEAGQEVQYLFQANQGLAMAPLAEVASGGELARVALALRLLALDGPPLVVLDEVDAGVGGRTAGQVANVLAELGLLRQVLVVTHQASVAARARQHIFLAKAPSPHGVTTSAVELAGRERVQELARMLSGEEDSLAAVAHASSLMQQGLAWWSERLGAGIGRSADTGL